MVPPDRIKERHVAALQRLPITNDISDAAIDYEKARRACGRWNKDEIDKYIRTLRDDMYEIQNHLVLYIVTIQMAPLFHVPYPTYDHRGRLYRAKGEPEFDLSLLLSDGGALLRGQMRRLEKRGDALRFLPHYYAAGIYQLQPWWASLSSLNGVFALMRDFERYHRPHAEALMRTLKRLEEMARVYTDSVAQIRDEVTQIKQSYDVAHQMQREAVAVTAVQQDNIDKFMEAINERVTELERKVGLISENLVQEPYGVDMNQQHQTDVAELRELLRMAMELKRRS